MTLQGRNHANLLVQVLVTSMADPETVASPDLAREYSKLFTAASKSREVDCELPPVLGFCCCCL